ncbi:TBCC domain-containing protein 1 [Cichlidogyrus casuarinus]|uniref:TBCC domain-containing protein 1 n=1 Tax=Cichlidogyrus casuarinus TaxID=1844966 RepID=A0ABD2Q6C8_9PLAT
MSKTTTPLPVQMWVRAEPFIYGVYQITPHLSLNNSNIRRLTTYAKSKGAAGFPEISYQVWKHVATSKMGIPEDLAWNLFHSCAVISSRSLSSLKLFEEIVEKMNNSTPGKGDQTIALTYQASYVEMKTSFFFLL